MSQFGGSRASQRSRKSGANSYVDETLFGGSKAKAASKAGASAAVVSLEELRTIRGKTEKNNQNDAVIITRSDMARIRMATTIKTKEQLG